MLPFQASIEATITHAIDSAVTETSPGLTATQHAEMVRDILNELTPDEALCMYREAVA